MEFLLVRHALPVRIDAADIAEPAAADPGLAPRGREQAGRLANFLKQEGITAIHTSPIRRARETAAILADAIGVVAVVEDGLAEWDAASSSYIPVEEMKAAGDPRWHALRAGDFYDPDADPVAFRSRVVAAVEATGTRHREGPLAFVTHAGVINAYAGHVLGQEKPFWLPLTRSPGYCSITRIWADPDGSRRAISVNETSHVRDLLSAPA